MDSGSVNKRDALTLPVDASTQKASTDYWRDVGARMKAAREALKLSRPAFATKYGGTVRTLENAESGGHEPRAGVIASYVQAGVDATWLLTGQGLMLLVDEAHPAKATDVDLTKINRGALAALLRGAIAITAQGMSVEAAADMAAEMYERALQNGEITPTGVGEGNMNKAA